MYKLSVITGIFITVAAVAAAGTGLFLLFNTQRSQLALRLPGQDNSPKDQDQQIPLVVEGTLKTFDAQPADLEGAWPQFRGPDRDSVSDEQVELLDTWPENGPPVIWTIDVGEGHAGPAVLNGRLYIIDYDRKNEADLIRCINPLNGKDIWQYSYPNKVKRNHGMSRTVPAVTDNHVLTLGPKGHLTCLDSKSGQFKWMKNLPAEYKTEIPPWYAGQCPLIDDGKAIIAPAGPDVLITALDIETGETIWTLPNEKKWSMTHSSIMTMTQNNEKMYIYCASGGVVAASSRNGLLLWQTDKWTIRIANVPSPCILDQGLIFFSGGYNAGSMMIKLIKQNDQFTPEVQFTLKPEIFGSPQHTPVFYKERIYGVRPDGQFVAMSKTGSILFQSGSGNTFGLGPYIIADEKLFIMNDHGHLTMAKAFASDFQILANAKVLQGPDSWAPMAIVSGRLILRDLNKMICLDMRK